MNTLEENRTSSPFKFNDPTSISLDVPIDKLIRTSKINKDQRKGVILQKLRKRSKIARTHTCNSRSCPTCVAYKMHQAEGIYNTYLSGLLEFNTVATSYFLFPLLDEYINADALTAAKLRMLQQLIKKQKKYERDEPEEVKFLEKNQNINGFDQEMVDGENKFTGDALKMSSYNFDLSDFAFFSTILLEPWICHKKEEPPIQLFEKSFFHSNGRNKAEFPGQRAPGKGKGSAHLSGNALRGKGTPPLAQPPLPSTPLSSIGEQRDEIEDVSSVSVDESGKLKKGIGGWTLRERHQQPSYQLQRRLDFYFESLRLRVDETIEEADGLPQSIRWVTFLHFKFYTFEEIAKNKELQDYLKLYEIELRLSETDHAKDEREGRPKHILTPHSEGIVLPFLVGAGIACSDTSRVLFQQFVKEVFSSDEDAIKSSPIKFRFISGFELRKLWDLPLIVPTQTSSLPPHKQRKIKAGIDTETALWESFKKNYIDLDGLTFRRYLENYAVQFLDHSFENSILNEVPHPILKKDFFKVFDLANHVNFLYTPGSKQSDTKWKDRCIDYSNQKIFPLIRLGINKYSKIVSVGIKKGSQKGEKGSAEMSRQKRFRRVTNPKSLDSQELRAEM